jgi:hypothetical protein
MRHRCRDRPRGVDGDSPLADRTLTPRGPEMGHQEGPSGVTGTGPSCLAMSCRAGFGAVVARSGGWRPIQSP